MLHNTFASRTPTSQILIHYRLHPTGSRIVQEHWAVPERTDLVFVKRNFSQLITWIDLCPWKLLKNYISESVRLPRVRHCGKKSYNTVRFNSLLKLTTVSDTNNQVSKIIGKFIIKKTANLYFTVHYKNLMIEDISIILLCGILNNAYDTED